MAKRSGRHAAPFHRRAALHFQCTACGKCCATGADRHVFLDRDEAQRIRAYLGIGWAWFRRRYLRRDAALGWMLQVHHARASCVFLDEHGKCSVYPVRPRQCVTYPFWPEVLASARAWRGEARRCEGIGSGPRIAPRAVAAALRAAGGA